MRTITIINQKGGCGKTTTAINLSSALARSGLRVLLVDMDPQSHCAAGLGVPENKIDQDIGDAMLAPPTRPFDTARLLWRAGKNLDLAPSRFKLAGLEASRGGLADRPDRERRLAGVLERFRADYDVTIIDSSPSIGLLTYNTLVAANTVIIPVETGYFSLQGATKQVSTIKSLAKRLGVSLQTLLLPTIHDEASPVACDLLEELRRRFSHHVIPVVIRRDPKVRDAASFGQAIHEYAPDCEGSSDYLALCDWFLDTMGLRQPGMPRRLSLVPMRTTPLDDMLPDSPDSELNQELNAEVEAELDAEMQAAEAGIRADQSPPNDGASMPSVAGGSALAHEIGQMIGQTPHLTPGALAQTAPCEPVPGLSRAAELVQRAQKMMRRNEAGLRLTDNVEIKPDRASSAQMSKILLGVRQTSQGALFTQPASAGKTLAIAGSFNGWSPTSNPMRLNEELGVFELLIPLPPGDHQYRLVVDGEWRADDHNPRIQYNPFGESNNVCTVRSQTRSAVSSA